MKTIEFVSIESYVVDVKSDVVLSPPTPPILINITMRCRSRMMDKRKIEDIEAIVNEKKKNEIKCVIIIIHFIFYLHNKSFYWSKMLVGSCYARLLFYGR